MEEKMKFLLLMGKITHLWTVTIHQSSATTSLKRAALGCLEEGIGLDDGRLISGTTRGRKLRKNNDEI